MLFGLFKCVAAFYDFLNINGDGIYMLRELNISIHLYRMRPCLITWWRWPLPPGSPERPGRRAFPATKDRGSGGLRKRKSLERPIMGVPGFSLFIKNLPVLA